MSEGIQIKEGLDKGEKYKALLPQLFALTKDETDIVANTANIVAALNEAFSFFWIGIYFVKKQNGIEELVLGPFQGPVACVRIGKGRGVCGTSWMKKEAIIVPDVEKFPGHIACSALSRSEIVVPVLKNNEVIAVIDVDSKSLSDFDETDQQYLMEVANLISDLI